MRLFQLIGEEDLVLGLFNCTVPAAMMSNEEVEDCLKSDLIVEHLLTIRSDAEEFENYLYANNLERVFVNEVYTK